MVNLDVKKQECGIYKVFRVQDGKFSGALSAYHENDSWMIEEINAWPQRRGIGSALLRAFSKFVGEDQRIKAYLVHRPSLRAIRINGLLPSVVTDEVTINDPGKLSLLPLTRVFRSGNIEATQLSFVKARSRTGEKDILAFYEVILSGITI